MPPCPGTINLRSTCTFIEISRSCSREREKLSDVFRTRIYHVSSSINDKGRDAVREVLLEVLIISDKPTHIDVKEYMDAIYRSLYNIFRLRVKEISRLVGNNFSRHFNEYFKRSDTVLNKQHKGTTNMKNMITNKNYGFISDVYQIYITRCIITVNCNTQFRFSFFFYNYRVKIIIEK